MTRSLLKFNWLALSIMTDFTWIVDVLLILAALFFCGLFFWTLFYGSTLGLFLSGGGVLACGLILKWWRGTEEWL